MVRFEGLPAKCLLTYDCWHVLKPVLYDVVYKFIGHSDHLLSSNLAGYFATITETVFKLE